MTDLLPPIRLVCSGSAEFPHRKILVYKTQDGAIPFSMADSSVELKCRRCGQAPRPGGLTMRGLLMLARDAGGELDIRRA